MSLAVWKSCTSIGGLPEELAGLQKKRQNVTRPFADRSRILGGFSGKNSETERALQKELQIHLGACLFTARLCQECTDMDCPGAREYLHCSVKPRADRLGDIGNLPAIGLQEENCI